MDDKLFVLLHQYLLESPRGCGLSLLPSSPLALLLVVSEEEKDISCLAFLLWRDSIYHDSWHIPPPVVGLDTGGGLLRLLEPLVLAVRTVLGCLFV